MLGSQENLETPLQEGRNRGAHHTAAGAYPMSAAYDRYPLGPSAAFTKPSPQQGLIGGWLVAAPVARLGTDLPTAHEPNAGRALDRNTQEHAR